MNLLIATPLYPPDIAGSAPYVKELGRRLHEKGHLVTILTYSHIPEQIPGVSIISVEKRMLLPLRILSYAYLLRKALREVDHVLVENGPSTELPLFLSHIGYRHKIIFHLFDAVAEKHAQDVWLYRFVRALGIYSARMVLTHTEQVEDDPKIRYEGARPERRPEILPFNPYPEAAFASYTRSWEEHLERLQKLWNT